MSLPKILCLHGYSQSGTKLALQMRKIRKALEGSAELVFLTAPHEMSIEDTKNFYQFMDLHDLPIGDNHRWWNSINDGKEYLGVEESLGLVKNAFANNGPFVGVLGFSQGGSVATLLAGLNYKAMQNGTENSYPFKFLVNVAGFCPRSEAYKPLFEKPLQFPSMHVVGDKDRVQSISGIGVSASKFVDPVIFRHPGGHDMPKDEEHIQKLAFAIQNMMSKL